MARAEARATLAGGIRFMNQHLITVLPHRTIEAIKGKRRSADYQEMVREFCQQGVSADESLLDESNDATDDGTEAEEAMTRALGSPSAHDDDTNFERLALNAAPQILDGSEQVRSAIEALSRLSARVTTHGAAALREIASDALAGMRVMPAIDTWLGNVFPQVRARPRRHDNRPRTHRPPDKENREQKRKREYALVQNLFRTNMRSCLGYILDGKTSAKRPSDGDFEAYWRPVFESSSSADGNLDDLRTLYNEPWQRVRSCPSKTPPARGRELGGPDGGVGADNNRAPDKTLLWDPITRQDVERISVRTGSAPGLDGITPRAWNAVPAVLRALLFNLLLLAREVPESISLSKTVFLEKGGMPESPSPADYRPLSIGSVVLRQFHKILGQRLAALDVVDQRQRGFRKADGVAENTTILSAVLDDSRRRCRSLHMACVDMSKAFDTVSHDAIHVALEEAALPNPFREYVKTTYSHASTVLHLPNLVEKPMTHLGRGVKQGDPLSPLLFNLVVDRAVGVLSEDVGYKLGAERINALAYADDIVLLASTKTGLQENLNRLQAALLRNGLDINPRKTTVLSLVASGRDKKVKLVTKPSFTLGGATLEQCSNVKTWRYLGRTYEGARELTHVPPLGLAIERLSHAPLKPQQRLQLLRDCLLPRYYHLWLAGSTTTKILRTADKTIRAGIRRWLRLPNDVPVGYFHAPLQSGGLGLPMLATYIPILKHNRLRRVCLSALPAARAAAESTYVARQSVWCENRMRVNGERVVSLAPFRKQCADMLHASHDGRGLREVSSSKLSSYWSSYGAHSIPGADFVHYHHVRANCIPSRTRTSRGREGHEVLCRAGCPEKETPSHCVQRCFRTHGGRILRHDDLVRKVGGFLKQKGWQVELEQSYPTSAGRRRPDLTAVRDGTAAVVDAQVVDSEGSLDMAHERKVEKYRSNDDLVDRVAEKTGVPRNDVRFTALTISWRGVWSPRSERELRELGLTMGQLRTLTTRVLWGSWLNWRRFNTITSRYFESRSTGAVPRMRRPDSSR